MDKINSLLQKHLSEIILKEHNHPSFKLITIVSVDTYKDLSEAKVHVDSLENKEDLVKYLSKIQPVIQKKIARQITLRKIPKIQFVADIGSEQLNRINSLIDQIEGNSNT